MIDGGSSQFVRKRTGERTHHKRITAGQIFHFSKVSGQCVAEDSRKEIAEVCAGDDTIVAVGGLVHFSNCAVFEAGGEFCDTIRSESIVGMHSLCASDRSWRVSRVLADRLTEIIISGVPSLPFPQRDMAVVSARV